MDGSLLESAFRSAQRRLWGLCYRMTGVAADADELVQETFVRAMESGRNLTGLDLERWMTRVATNLSVDCLRRRRCRAYFGPWLPSPRATTATTDVADTATAQTAGTAHMVEQAEEVSYAFLVAIEALSPRARAALLLIDVLDYPAAEVARIPEASENNVRVPHYRGCRLSWS